MFIGTISSVRGLLIDILDDISKPGHTQNIRGSPPLG